jgi:TIGR03009 family protein
MRIAFLSALAYILLAVPVAYCQQNQPAAPLDPDHIPLDNVLLHWEGSMKRIDSLKAWVVEEKINDVLRTRTTYEGEAKYLKPNLASFELRRRDKPDVYEKYICTGTYFYAFYPQNKLIRAYEMPVPKPGQVADDNFLSFLFGMKAEEAKRRYELKLMSPQNPDKNYFYLEVLPRSTGDREDFQKAWLALSQQSLLPSALMFVEPNGNRVRYDIRDIQANIRLNPNDFAKPPVPPGWRLEVVPRPDARAPGTPQPRVFRPNQ